MNRFHSCWKPAICLSLLLCMIGCHKKPVAVPPPAPLLDQAKMAFDGDRFEEAARLLEEFLNQNPSGTGREEAVFLLAASYSIPDSPAFNPGRASQLLDTLTTMPSARATPLVRLSRALVRVGQRSQDLAAQVAALEQAHRQAVEQLSQSQAETQTLQARITELENEKQTLSQHLELRRERVTDLIRKLESAEARNTRLQTEIESMKKVLESMKKIDLPKK